MLVTQRKAFPVPVALTTILTIRELATASDLRTLSFTNLCGDDITVQLYEYVDASWDTLGEAITLHEFGTAGYVHVENIDSLNMLQIRVSGGSAGVPEIIIDYTRSYESDADTWISPFL